MTFKKGNKYGKKLRLLTAYEMLQIRELINKGFGYAKIYKVTKISKSTLKAYGFKTSNKRKTLKRVKKSSLKNPSDVEFYVDMSDNLPGE